MKSCSLRVKVVILLVCVFSLSTAIFAESKITVKGKAPYSKAEVKLHLNENIYYGGKNKLKFTAKGLQSRSIYTVWLEKGSQTKGLGDFPYSFIADSSGKVSYTVKVEAHKLGNWQVIKVLRHKDAVAQNIDESNLETVFLIDIEEFLSGKAESSQAVIKPKISIYKGPLKFKIPEASSY